MRNPDPPFLELGFYFRGLSGRDAFYNLVRTLTTKFKAVPKEATVTSTGTTSYPSPDAKIIETNVKIDRPERLWQLFSDQSTFVQKVALENGTRIVPDAKEFAVVLPVRRQNPENDKNSVAIWIEGESLSHADSFGGSTTKSSKVGSRALAVFKDLVTQLQPTYGAITVDYGLETPYDLRDDPRTYAFRDFYLDRTSFGDDSLRAIRDRFPNAVHQDFANGQITTTTRVFSRTPWESDIPSSEAYSLSVFVGRMVSRIC
jgi:hypothetical protein